MFWDMIQQSQINALRQDAASERGRAGRAEDSARQATLLLEQRIDRMGLICRAMWSLIEEHTRLQESGLAERITEIDMEDGHLDGRVAPPARDCPQCNAKISPKFGRCLFCGYEPPEDPDPFGGV